MPDEIISQREFASRVGVTPPAVTNAIASKRITPEANGKINFTTQVIAWYKNRDVSKIREHNAPDDAKPEMQPLASAKLAKETYTAKLKQAEYEEKIGRLIEKDAVRRAAFSIFREVRDGILNIPDRISAEAAAEIKKETGLDVDSHVLERIVHRLWDRESRDVLSRLSQGMEL